MSGLYSHREKKETTGINQSQPVGLVVVVQSRDCFEVNARRSVCLSLYLVRVRVEKSDKSQARQLNNISLMPPTM